MTVIQTLKNGLRIATDPSHGHFTTLGLFLHAGSRYECPSLRGVSHIIDRLAFRSTQTLSEDEMLMKLEMMGGSQQCSSSRESIMYTASVFNQNVEGMLSMIKQTVLNPKITEEELLGTLDTANYEIGEIWQKPEMIMPELLHAAAYNENTLGEPLLCPEERLDLITKKDVLKYRELFVRPERMVLAFVGVSDTEALKLGEKYFGHLELSSSDKRVSDTVTNTNINPSLLSSLTSRSSLRSEYFIDESPSRYTGGQIHLPHPRYLPMEPYAHLHIAFEAPSLSSPQIYALATLQILLGGGGSFSAGGPGKGMYSRLYSNVLNQYGWVESAIGGLHSYSDSGLLSISGSCRPDASYALAGVLARELALLADSSSRGIGEVEARRAKNQLKSSLLMNLESRAIALEDIGRQIQSPLQKRIAAQEMCDKIESLTVRDLREVAEMVVTGKGGTGSGRPSIVIAGPGGDNVGDVFGVCERFGLGRK